MIKLKNISKKASCYFFCQVWYEVVLLFAAGDNDDDDDDEKKDDDEPKVELDANNTPMNNFSEKYVKKGTLVRTKKRRSQRRDNP